MSTDLSSRIRDFIKSEAVLAIAAVAALYALFTFIKDRRREKREAHAPRHRKQ